MFAGPITQTGKNAVLFARGHLRPSLSCNAASRYDVSFAQVDENIRHREGELSILAELQLYAKGPLDGPVMEGLSVARFDEMKSYVNQMKKNATHILERAKHQTEEIKQEIYDLKAYRKECEVLEEKRLAVKRKRAEVDNETKRKKAEIDEKAKREKAELDKQEKDLQEEMRAFKKRKVSGVVSGVGAAGLAAVDHPPAPTGTAGKTRERRQPAGASSASAEEDDEGTPDEQNYNQLVLNMTKQMWSSM